LSRMKKVKEAGGNLEELKDDELAKILRRV
jgi:hypothetical protein